MSSKQLMVEKHSYATQEFSLLLLHLLLQQSSPGSSLSRSLHRTPWQGDSHRTTTCDHAGSSSPYLRNGVPAARELLERKTLQLQMKAERGQVKLPRRNAKRMDRKDKIEEKCQLQ